MQGWDHKTLKGGAEDETFHRSRIMFCIKSGQVKVSAGNSPLSHLQWFESEGWLAGRSVQEFLEENIRGFYLPQEDRIFFYKGMGWSFDEDLFTEVVKNMEEIKEALGLNNDTEVHLGPKDAYIAGMEQERKYAGKLGEIMSGKWVK